MSGDPALKDQLEKARKRMEEAADRFGLNHPAVYELSRELDELHNLWEQETILHQRGEEIIYPLRSPMQRTKKRSKQAMMKAI
ncbi:aspartyl-phosphate phosphatase Spo0E family protein [Thermoactinomyces sp. FSL K6-2592]|uniref:aspartyl-phosphate phosphatase Spo0E family protein n=1 Tax=Thermoactinomyces sp. FSL K6-2592 TaxID=2975347 RepID=UPI0030F9D0CF